MQENFFNAHTGLTDLHWWLGQIVDESTWKGNEKRSKWGSPEDIPGYGTRCKVRIFGRDSANKETPDDQLEMAELLYPVTAGSGHGGGYQSANLSHGTYVIGFYKDGVDATEPIIFGCLGNNEQTKLSRNIPLTGFVPFSGYNGKGVPYYSIPPGGSPPVGGPSPQEGCSNKTSQNNACDAEHKKDGETQNPIQTRCEVLPVTGIQLTIKNLIKDIENAQKQLDDWQNAVLKPINYKGQQMSVSDYINMKVQMATNDITKFVKNIITKIRKFVTEKVNNTLKDFYYLLFPDQRPGLRVAVEEANNLLSCLFNKIISNLLKMIGKFLLQAIDNLVTTPLCIIENFISSLLGQLTGLISAAVNNIIKPIESIIGQAFDLAGDILGFIGDLLGLFTCEEKPSCSKLEEWSIFDGPEPLPTLDVDKILNAAKALASTFTEAIDPDNFDFDLDFSNVFTNTCNTGPIACGPPTVEFFGGGGSGILANTIISTTGNLLGVDIISSGFGFTQQPTIMFKDSCGNGSGAYGRALIGPVSPIDDPRFGKIYVPDENGTQTGVVDIVIENPGTGYLPAPDGSQGGDGRVWAGKCDSTIRRANGKWEVPYSPGRIMKIDIGDTVQLAGQPAYIATESQSITAPECPPVPPAGSRPSTSAGQYPVYLSFCKLLISNPGLNYSEGDKIIVEPNNGAVLEPMLGPFGTIEKVNIISVGVGYTEPPDVYIESETGYNAKILPVMCVNRIGDRPQEEDTTALISQNIQIIQVVDCVGKV